MEENLRELLSDGQKAQLERIVAGLGLGGKLHRSGGLTGGRAIVGVSDEFFEECSDGKVR